MPSTVLTRRPAQARPRARQESTGWSSSNTVQVPHSPSSHPCLVPVRPQSSRRTSSSVLCGANATSVCSPFSAKAMVTLGSVMWGNLILPRRGCDGSLRVPLSYEDAMMQAVGRSSGRAVVLATLLLTAGPPVRLTAQAGAPKPSRAAVDYRARALALLKTVPLIDGHNDLADAIREGGGLDSVDL